MKLNLIVEELDTTPVAGSQDPDTVEITELIYDTRKIVPGCLFICIRGTTRDSHDLIPEIMEKGAAAILIDRDIPEDQIATAQTRGITILRARDNRRSLACCSAAYFDHPARKLITIGITGTKGKTTTSYMVQSILEQSGAKVGVIGTIGAVIDGQKQKTANTTPESYELQRLFSLMVEAGCQYCVMEVSSQGLKLHRVAGFTFDIGVFTNFSADHIGPNEHADMEEYLYCKSLLFRQCKHGIINIDDPAHDGVTKDHTCTISTYGVEHPAHLTASDITFVRKPGILGIEYNAHGLMDARVSLSVPGYFSVYNSLVAISVAKALNISEETILHALANIQVRGRVEIIPVSDRFTIMIDYAHNEASVESLLTTILAYKPGRIVCVYGGGGNRSKLRRYAMGELCGRLAQLSILTCDNPRDEEISSINADIKVGLARSNGKYIEIEDRAEAIEYSMDHAQDGDVIICLGKGHEDYQEIKGVKYHFSEREVIEAYRDRHKA